MEKNWQETLTYKEMERVKDLCGFTINQLIPARLNKYNKDKFMRLFCGYIRGNYENLVPDDIMDSIVSFYAIISHDTVDE